MRPIEIRDQILRAALPGAKLMDDEPLSPGKRLHLSDSPVCGATAWVTFEGVKTHRLQVATNSLAYIHTWLPSVEYDPDAGPVDEVELDRAVAVPVGSCEEVSDACAAVAALWDNSHEWLQREREARRRRSSVSEIRA